MITVEQIAQAAIDGDALRVRSLVLDLLRQNPQMESIPRPAIADQTVLAAAAAIVELLAQRRQQRPPTWTQSVGAISPPVFLLKSATKMRRLREMCQAEAPEPLRRRGFYAPAIPYFHVSL